ncbi:MAG: taurine dioxygenase [Balneolaceae bacterium]|nr:taurine dioxygenase [Balneolaceae bacterium]
MVDEEKVRKLLYDDEEYLKEFAGAAVESYTEFRNHYARAFETGDVEFLRKAGHKIKPSAQMLEFEELLEEYEHGKNLLEGESDKEEKETSVDRMTKLCDQIIVEMKELES